MSWHKLHKPYAEWMQALLDGALANEARRDLEAHLASCPQCHSAWESLSAAHRLFKAAPMAAPRPGFAGRFNARLARQRSRPRLIWGGVALGAASLAAVAVATAVLLPAGVTLFATVLRLAMAPATPLALSASLSAAASFAATVLDALYIAARAVVSGALASPLAWAGAVLALGLTAVWVYVLRRIDWEVHAQ